MLITFLFIDYASEHCLPAHALHNLKTNLSCTKASPLFRKPHRKRKMLLQSARNNSDLEEFQGK